MEGMERKWVYMLWLIQEDTHTCAISVLLSKGCWGPESRYGSVCCRSFWHLSKMRFSLAFNFYFNIAFVIRALPTQVCRDVFKDVWARELELEQEQEQKQEQVGNLSVVCFVPGVHRLYIHVTLESIFPAYFCMSFFFIWLSLKLCVLKTVDISMGEALSTVCGVWGLLPFTVYLCSLPELPTWPQELTWRSLKCQMFPGTPPSICSIHHSIYYQPSIYPTVCPHIHMMFPSTRLLMEIAVDGGVWRRRRRRLPVGGAVLAREIYPKRLPVWLAPFSVTYPAILCLGLGLSNRYTSSMWNQILLIHMPRQFAITKC